jgi:acetyl-CoA C-acetyltransferase
LKLRPAALLNPVIGLMKGLTDPVVGLLMGQTAENLAWKFGINRQQMDEFAVRSHQRALAGREAGHFGEIVPVVDAKGNIYAEDDGVRADASMAGMAKLKPFFDKKYGNITAANSSQITDGAAWLILASEEAVKNGSSSRSAKSSIASGPASIRRRWVSARCMPRRRSCSATARRSMTSMPGKSTKRFAAQVLGCQAAWKSDDYCREQLGLPGALGALDEKKLNVDGGAVAIGHPVGASGARIVLHLLHVLRANN